MGLSMILFLSLFFLCVKGQTTQPPNYSCNQNNDSVDFTLFGSAHSAWESTSNCSLQQCQLSSSNNGSCLLSSTPCYDYHSLNNSGYCAPGIVCSILESCNNTTYACTSNTSVCVINSCCSPQAVCLPLSATDFCISDTTTTTSSTSSITSISTSTTTTTTSRSTSTSTTTTTSKTTSTTSTTTTSTTTKITTTTTPTTTITTYSCSASIPASLGTVSGTMNTSWTQYTYNYTANKANPMLTFGIDATTGVYIALDDVSVVDTANSSVQLLINPSFENSSLSPTGWNLWCSSTCNAGSGGTVITSGCRSGICYRSECGGGGHDYLVQTFSATVGRNYIISFWSERIKFIGGVGTTVTLYVGII